PYLYRATGETPNAIVREDASEDNTCIDADSSLRTGAKPLRTAIDVDADGKDEVRVLCNWRDERECEALDPHYRKRGQPQAPTRYREWSIDLNGDGVDDHVRCGQTLEEDGNGALFFGLRDLATAEIEAYSALSVPRALCLPSCAGARGEATLYLDVDGDGIQNLVFFDGGWKASPLSRGGRPRGQSATGWQALVYANGEAQLVPVPGIPAP